MKWSNSPGHHTVSPSRKCLFVVVTLRRRRLAELLLFDTMSGVASEWQRLDQLCNFKQHIVVRADYTKPLSPSLTACSSEVDFLLSVKLPSRPVKPCHLIFIHSFFPFAPTCFSGRAAHLWSIPTLCLNIDEFCKIQLHSVCVSVCLVILFNLRSVGSELWGLILMCHFFLLIQVL